MRNLLPIMLLSLLLPAGWAYSQEQHTFVAGSHDSTTLFSVDIATCTIHNIGTLPIGVFTIACTPNGKLWAIQSNDFGHLYSVDTITGQLTYIDSFDTQGDYVQSLGVLNDSVLLIQCWNDLYGITTNNVHSFRIGSIGYNGYCDMAWLGQDLFIMCYAGTNLDSLFLVKVTFNNGSYPPIASSVRVGNTPSLPRCYGLATYILPNTDTVLIGFADSNAYIINPLDGSYTLFCPVLPDTLYASDATSTIYPSIPIIIDTVNPVDTNHTTIDNPLNNGLMVKIYPNPVKDYLYVNCQYPHAAFVFTDITGKVILSKALKNGINDIYMGFLTSGLYLSSIQIEGNIIYRQKIIKQN